MQELGERIRHVRGRMSQEAFAGLLGISKGALGGYERGENCPNADYPHFVHLICGGKSLLHSMFPPHFLQRMYLSTFFGFVLKNEA